MRQDEAGVLFVGSTRVTLDTVVGAYLDGGTPETIVSKYPTLDLADVYAALSYYLRHRNAVDVYVRQRREETAHLQGEIEAVFPPDGVRARLLARREQTV